MSVPVPGVLETPDFDLSSATVNVDEARLVEQMAGAVRRGHPQLVQQATRRPERVVLLGSGPSLNDGEAEVVDLVRRGAKLVTCNGSYHWAIERNLKPSAQVILDARPENARFVDPEMPGCAYLLASQCHPRTWDAVAGREKVWIWHPVQPKADGPIKELLDRYYFGRWAPVQGGCTVISRALWLLRMQGYLRFDLFGVDCCWRGDEHHALAQPENDKDPRCAVTVEPPEAPERARTFVCSPWHIKQYEDLLMQVRMLGNEFLLRVHGDGLLAYTLQTAAALETTITVTKE